MLPAHLQVTERNRLTNDFEQKILKLNSRVDDGELMKPKEAITISKTSVDTLDVAVASQSHTLIIILQ
jgi:hypothetical protein